MRKQFLAAALLLACSFAALAQNPAGTYRFAQREGGDLYMDVYAPSPGSGRTFEGHAKPTILFVFGGGFVTGERSEPGYMPWFKILNDNGYRVITVDYRLGLKGVSMGFSLFKLTDTAKKTKHAVDMGVEDVFAAVRFICDNAQVLDVDPANIVLAGSSAGAMISLSSEYEICNGSERTAVLPEGFQFAGVMAFAGAIMSDHGTPSYRSEPCPQLLLHGTADETVKYGKLRLFRWGIFGTDALSKVYAKKGYDCNILRYKDHGHDIASHFVACWPEEKRFLEVNVMGGHRRIVDALIDDPTVAKWDAPTLDTLY